MMPVGRQATVNECDAYKWSRYRQQPKINKILVRRRARLSERGRRGTGPPKQRFHTMLVRLYAVLGCTVAGWIVQRCRRLASLVQCDAKGPALMLAVQWHWL